MNEDLVAQGGPTLEVLPEVIAQLRADFDSAHWSEAFLQENLGSQALELLEGGTVSAAKLKLQPLLDSAGEDPSGNFAAAALTWVFVLGQSIDPSVLDAALPQTTTVGLQKLGLVETAAQRVRAQVSIRPFQVEKETLWLAYDLPGYVTKKRPSAQQVLGVGGATKSLLQATVLPPTNGSKVLDLGTGCGVQALTLALRLGRPLRSAVRFIATDTNRRALDFAHFNALLNQVDLELRQGSLFEPVEQLEFDLVVANPPFVITSPAGQSADTQRLEFRDGGFEGDSLMEQVVRQVPQYLSEGAVAQIIGNWLIAGDWDARVRQWIPSGMDAWVCQRQVLSAEKYVQMWLTDAGAHFSDPDWESSWQQWVEQFQDAGFGAVGLGQMVLRRTAAEGRIICEDTSQLRPLRSDCVRHFLNTATLLRGVSEDEFATWKLQVSPDVVEERFYRAGSEELQLIRLRSGQLLGRVTVVDSVVAGVVGACDGTLPVGVLLDTVTQLLEITNFDRPAYLRELQSLLFQGFLFLDVAGSDETL